MGGISSFLCMAKKPPESPCTVGAKPIIIYSYRSIDAAKGMENYNEKAKKWADEVKRTVPGFKANCYCEHPTLHNPPEKLLVVDVQWFNSINVFRKHMFFDNPYGMKLMFDFTSATDANVPFTGYAFGDWGNTVMMGITLPKMFAMLPPMMNGPKWFEMREEVCGFIRGTPASTSKPPIMILSEFWVKPELRADFIETYKKIADKAFEASPRVIAMHLTQESLSSKLLDQAKSRDPSKLVAIAAFEDLDSFKASFPVVDWQSYFSKPANAEIWADSTADAEAVKESVTSIYGPDGTFITLQVKYGWNDHKCVCHSVPEIPLPENGETCYGKLEEKNIALNELDAK